MREGKLTERRTNDGYDGFITLHVRKKLIKEIHDLI